MKPNTKSPTFEAELPEGYKPVYYLNAKNAKIGIIMNIVAIAVLFAVMAVAFLIGPELEIKYSTNNIVAWLVFAVAIIAYIVLHELVHGAAYKALTRQKLTFGMSWSCAFCGVPQIYTYRRTALIATLAPLVLFTIIFIPLIAVLAFVDPLYYYMAAFIFGNHLGGCCGDIYVTILLTCKYKSAKLLVRDTGPEQTFYLPEGE